MAGEKPSLSHLSCFLRIVSLRLAASKVKVNEKAASFLRKPRVRVEKAGSEGLHECPPGVWALS